MAKTKPPKMETIRPDKPIVPMAISYISHSLNGTVFLQIVIIFIKTERRKLRP